MGRYNVFKNNPFDINISEDYQDNGWSTSNNVAIHDKINSGFFRNKVFFAKANEKYKITIVVSVISSGNLIVYLGDVILQTISAPGEYVMENTPLVDGYLRLWSDADLNITSVLINKGQVEYNTIAFDNDENMFPTYVSYTADIMNKFLDDFYTFKNGTLWLHNENDTRNSFYGVEYPSIITFYINPECTPGAEVEKDFFSMILNSTDPWYVEDIYIFPKNGKSKGQRSRIKPGNFKYEHGKYVADFLRDMTDPRFTDELTSLMHGATLQGMLMKVTISNNSIKETFLNSVETEYSPK